MIHETSEAIGYLKQIGFNQVIIFMMVIILFLLFVVVVNTFIEGVVKIIVSFLSFNKEKKYYKLVDRHLIWYRQRSKELLNQGKTKEASAFMDKSIADLYEVMKHVSTESEQPVSGETGQTVNRPSNDKQQSHGEITD